MAKGLPKTYIKKWGITKKAWREYHKAQARRSRHISRARKGASKSRKVTKSTKKSNPKRSVRRTGKSLQRTVFKWLRIGALLGPAGFVVAGGGTPEAKIARIIHLYSGFNPGTGKFNPAMLMAGWGPFIGTSLVTVGLPKLLGILRRI